MKKSFRLIALIAGIAALAACTKSEPTPDPALAVSPGQATFVASDPTAATLNVTSNVAWTATSSDSWLTVSPASGNGNGTVTLTAAANIAGEGNAAAERSAKVTFTGTGASSVEIAVKQDAETVVFTAAGKDTEVPAEGATVYVTVQHNIDYTVDIPVDWIKSTATKAVKTDNLTYIVSENTAYEAREATLIFKSANGNQTVKISQKACEGPKKITNITSAEDFKSFAAAMKDYTKDETVTLGADITLPKDTTYVADTLRAAFDGQGHTITYEIESASETALSLGLFSTVATSVKNLNVAGKITNSTPNGDGHTIRMGGVAATLLEGATIDNCTSKVTILATTKNTHQMGGIAGFVYKGTTVSNCTNEGNVGMEIPELGAANASQLGGIVGHIEVGSTLTKDTNKGTITYKGNGTPRAAGICGYVNNAETVLFDHCINNGDIVWVEGEYTSTSWSYVGGITGYYGTPSHSANVTYDCCENTGNISGTFTETASKMRAGGIAAQAGISNTAYSANELSWIFKNCKNSGNITSDLKSANNIFGGILGVGELTAKVTVEGCETTGTISTPGSAKVGGIIGYNGGTESSFKDVNVNETIKVETASSALVGLLAGSNAAYTGTFSGKVAGEITVGSTTTKITKNNYTDFLFGKALGTGASTDGVTCDVEGEKEDTGNTVLKDTFDGNDWTTMGGDASTALTATAFPNWGTMTKIYYARPELGGVKLGTGSATGILVSKSLDLNKPFYIRLKAAAYGDSEGSLKVTAGSTEKTIDLTAYGNKQVTEFLIPCAATTEKTFTIATTAKRAYVISVDVEYGEATAIASAADFAKVLATASATTVAYLDADLDVTGITLNTIDTFAGILVGNGHKITGLTTTAPVLKTLTGTLSSINFVGAKLGDAVVGTVGGDATACSLNFDATSTVTYTVPTAATNYGVVADNNGGTVEFCTSAAKYEQTMETLPSKQSVNFGGIVGYTTGVVKSCKNTGVRSLTVTTPAVSTFHTFGGVVGQYEGKTGKAMVAYCNNTAAVSVAYNTAVYFFVGGVVGGTPSAKQCPNDYGNVEGCKNTGAVSMHYVNGGSGAYPNIGGVAGYLEGAVNNCTNTGNLTLTCDSEANTWTNPHAGGVAGSCTRGAKNCTNSGTITATGLFAGGTAGNQGAANSNQSSYGGVIGAAGPYTADANVVFENCSNTANLDIEPNSITGSPSSSFGGVFGYLTATAKSCTNKGSLTVKSPVGAIRAGGITGFASIAPVSCTNEGAVSADCLNNKYNSGTKTTDAEKSTNKMYVGGIAGDLSCSAATTVTGCKNSGALSVNATGAEKASEYYSYIGGIIGARKADVAATESSAAVSYAVTCTDCSNTGAMTNNSDKITCETNNEVGGQVNTKVQ